LGVLTNPVLIWASRGLERFLYARADHILVNSPAYREYLLGKGIDSAKISLIANGVDCHMFEPAAQGEQIRREFGLRDAFVVTYAGAMGMANDIPTILRAAQRLRNEADIRWMLVGDGKERAALQQSANTMVLPNVVFTGARPKTEMASFLAASDACVATLQNIPMFRTTYPNKVFDYMAAGRPTLLAIDGVIREVVEAADAGIFVPPGDDEALASAVLNLRQNPHRAREMGDAARQYVERNFDRRQQAAAFVALLQRVGSKHAPAISVVGQGQVR
jgi:glycosyltransferase involved in cell wall biosynthesis